MTETVWDHIDEIRGKVDRARRSGKGLRRLRRAVRTPEWVDSRGEYAPFFDDLELLWNNGQIVWAHIVQANEDLFKDGKDDLPAALVYSQHPKYDRRVGALRRVAQSLFSLKGYEYEDPDVDRFARIITSETQFGYNLSVPRALVGSESIKYNSIVIQRGLLPVKRLALTWFPIFVNPSVSRGTQLVPSTYWPGLLKDAWKAKQT